MPALTAEAFLGVLAKSRLLSPEQLVQAQAAPGADAQTLAQGLIHEGRLTRWQAQQLLAGRHAFYLRKYKLLDKLGEGGMGAVYKAAQTTTGRLVALKVMSEQVVKQPGAVSRFHREIRAVAALQHPNIVAAFDADQVGETHFLVMEYAEGRDLKEWIKEFGRLPIDWSCECIRQAALGLQHAHERGLAHRDIKPSNILVVSRDVGGIPQVKILDMGLARFTSETQCTVLTQTGQVLGTIDYMSPEQAKDTKGAGIQADIFSLGASLFHMLCGQVPFTGKSPMEKLMARAMRDAPRASMLRTDIPAELDAIIARMLERKPGDRYQTPDEVVAVLGPYCLGASSEKCTPHAPREAAFLTRNVRSTLGPIEAEADQTLGGFLASLAAESSGPDELAAPLAGPTGKMPVPRGMGVPPMSGTALAAGSSSDDDSRSRLPGLPGGTFASGETRPTSGARSRSARGTYYALAVVAASALVYFLWPWPATVTLDWPVKDRAGATLKIDGRPAPVANDSEWNLSLAPGIHEVEIRRADYPPVKLSLSAGRGERQTVTVPSPLKSPYSPAEAKSAQTRWSQQLDRPVESKNTIGMSLVLIPPGEFVMGTAQAEVDRLKGEYKSDGWFVGQVGHEVSEHRVRITRPFLLGKYEVTQREYAQLMGTKPSRFQEQGLRAPVEQVSWYDAVAFCNKLSEREKLTSYYRIEGNNVTVFGGSGYRLPTEAEWEYACRAGTAGQWSSGDDPLQVADYGWFNDKSGGKTHPVGEKQSNGLGLCDMHGNVWEWCWDWHGKYDAVAANDPTGPPTGSFPVYRGGCWGNSAWYARSAFRLGLDPSSRGDSLGFRLALSPSGK